MDTPTRKRHTAEDTHWKSSDDFLGDDENLHDQLPSVEEIRMSAASAGHVSSSSSSKASCRPVMMICVAAVAICALVIGLSVGLTDQNKNQEATDAATSTSTDDGTWGEDPPQEESRLDQAIAFLSAITEPAEFADLYTPRRRAARWMAEEDPMQYLIPTDVEEGREFIERYVAVLIYFSMNGPLWDVQLDFLTDKHICEWQATYPAGDGGASRKVGIGCDENYFVSDLHLPGNRLKGTIPVEIGEYKLESLNLNSNQIVGHIPATLVKSNANMILLALQHNDLTGTIPQWMGSMTEMEVLYLGNNKFAGSLPAEMAQMSSLQSLALSKNELLGDLSVLQALPSLSHVYADRNLFEGTLQETFDYMPQLKELDMSSNKLKGTLPEYFFKMTNLQILDLSDNEMGGPIPNAIPEGSGLKYLSLFANGFDGTIPSTIENAQSLTHVDLSANYLQGSIPTVLGSLTNLKYLFLAENRFTAGPIPSWISNLPNLQDLSLRETGLTGSIPSFLTSMSNLILLDVQKNSLVGTIPPKRVGSGVSKLRFILLNRNQLTGTIPYEFSRLSTLDMLLVDHNSFTGSLNDICGREMVPRVLTADCKGATPEIKCDCCSLCCAEGDDSCNDQPYLGNLDPIWENSFVRRFYEFGPSITFDGVEPTQRK